MTHDPAADDPGAQFARPVARFPAAAYGLDLEKEPIDALLHAALANLLALAGLAEHISEAKTVRAALAQLDVDVNIRRTYAYRLLARRVRREEQTCWLCLEPIDMTALPRSPRSWSLDHVIPLARGGAPLDRGNARAAHLGCNSASR